jgi:hypothetical protein
MYLMITSYLAVVFFRWTVPGAIIHLLFKYTVEIYQKSSVFCLYLAQPIYTLHMFHCY